MTELWQMEWWKWWLILFAIVYAYSIGYQIYETRFLKTKVDKVKEAMQRSESSKAESSKKESPKQESPKPEEAQPLTHTSPSVFDRFSNGVISLEKWIRSWIQYFINAFFHFIRVIFIKG